MHNFFFVPVSTSYLCVTLYAVSSTSNWLYWSCQGQRICKFDSPTSRHSPVTGPFFGAWISIFSFRDVQRFHIQVNDSDVGSPLFIFKSTYSSGNSNKHSGNKPIFFKKVEWFYYIFMIILCFYSVILGFFHSFYT